MQGRHTSFGSERRYKSSRAHSGLYVGSNPAFDLWGPWTQPSLSVPFPILVLGDKQFAHAERKGPWLIKGGHVSWNFNLELAGVGQEGWSRHTRGCGEQLGPYPSDLAGDWHLWGETAEQNSQLPSSRSLQVWGMFFPHLKIFCQWHTKVFENPPWLIETMGWQSTNILISQRD